VAGADAETTATPQWTDSTFTDRRQPHLRAPQNLGTYSAGARIDVLENGEHQDFLIATIPEPETWMLLAMGLGVVGLLRRRRAS
jgi:hypothetical protein